jgi:hypothetical protein
LVTAFYGDRNVRSLVPITVNYFALAKNIAGGLGRLRWSWRNNWRDLSSVTTEAD